MTVISATNTVPVQSQTNVDDLDPTSLTDVDTNSSPEIKSGFNYLDMLPGLVDGMQRNVIDVYVKIMAGYTKYVGELAELKSIISAASKAGEKSGDIDVTLSIILAKIDQMIADFSKSNPLAVSKQLGDDGYQEMVRWATELGLDPSKVVVRNGDGTSQINVDLAPLQAIRDSVVALTPAPPAKTGTIKDLFGIIKPPEKVDKVSVDTNRYQALLSSIDSQVQTPTNQVSVIGEKFGRQNTQMNALTQMVASIVSQVLQALSTMWR